MMVAAVSTTINPKRTPTPQNRNQTRPPLLPSDPDNALAPRRPKSREVTSRYMSTPSSSSSASKRCPSPLISRPTAAMTPAPAAVKRSQSVERRRAVTPRPNSLDMRVGVGNGEVSNAQRMLITSTRSLSVSFQGESFSLQVSKAKPTPSPIRKGTPERRKAATPTRAVDQAENSRPERWPARMRQPNSLSRSVDSGDDRKRVIGSGVSANIIRALQNSMIDNRSCSIESRLSSDSSNLDSEKINGSDSQCEHSVTSDTESVSSGSTSEGYNGHVGGGQGHRGQRGIMVPARFWQETNNRLRKQPPEPGSPVSKIVGLKGPVPAKLVAPKKFGFDSPVSSPKGVVNTRGQSSPIRGGALRPASPSKLGMSTAATLSPARGLSPSRVRNSIGGGVGSNFSSLNSTPSILGFAADIRRGKIGENRIVDGHFLRILYNRLLQWRFVNARADSALLAQRLNAEKNLYNARLTTSELRESVRAKRTELQWLRHSLKLTSILKGQMVFLEEWSHVDQDYSRSLSGAIEALQASTLRLPVVGGARADVQNVKDAICSAVDVMQAMASSICCLSSKVADANSTVSELANVTAKQRALLDQCRGLLSTIAAMQVKESSMRTHIVQLNRVPSTMITKV